MACGAALFSVLFERGEEGSEKALFAVLFFRQASVAGRWAAVFCYKSKCGLPLLEAFKGESVMYTRQVQSGM